MKIHPHHFNAESDLIESLRPLGIDESDCDPEEETHFIKRLLYDNSSPYLPEEFVSKTSDAVFESFSPSPIPVKDSDSLMEEIDLSFTLDYPMPRGIKEDEYDSERDIMILDELLSNDSLSLPKNESFHFDIPSSSRPPAKPPDGNIGILNVKVMGDIFEHKVPMPRLIFTQPTFVLNQEKSPNLLPYQGYEIFQPSAECPMMIHERNTPILDVLFIPRNLKTHVEGLCPPTLHFLSFIRESIISMKIHPHHFNAESDLIESLRNHDSSIISSSSKIDSLFDEFSGELTLLKSILLGIDESDCDPEEETHFIKRLLYDNSSPHLPEEFISKTSDAVFESFSPSPIPVKDSDSLMEEIDLSFTLDYPMPRGIKEDEYDSERDILILDELLSNDSLSLPKNESFHFDIPSSSRPPAKPPDGNIGILNVKVMGDIFEHKVPMPRLIFTQPTLVLNQEKSPDLLPYQGHEIFQPSAECPMMIHERNTPILDVLLFHFYPP
nr:hypothetical protein [Tanacetum cinerariifolium]